jgi:V8-like Glu-specific endopeptidase
MSLFMGMGNGDRGRVRNQSEGMPMKTQLNIIRAIIVASVLLVIAPSTHALDREDSPESSKDTVLNILAEVLAPEALEVMAQALGSGEVPSWGMGDQASTIVDGLAERSPIPHVRARSGPDTNDVPQGRSAPIDLARIMAEDAMQTGPGVRIGIGRLVNARISDGKWTRLAGEGWLWTLDIVSEGALGLRLHMAKLKLPAGAELLVYRPGGVDNIFGPVEGEGPDGDGQLWTPTISGERARIEYFVPQSQEQHRFRRAFVIDQMQHIYMDVGDIGSSGGDILPCHNKVACSNTAWITTSRAVGRIAFISGGSSYVCSGTMLNARNNDYTPYFLTAHHCISTNAEAQSAEIFWKYQAPTCTGAAPSLSSVPRSRVCRLLRSGPATDYSLLMIEGTLPSGMVWAGWDSGVPGTGASLACIHHPSGTQKRISFGVKDSSQTCASASTHGHIRWTSGRTQGGSSGAGVFRSDSRLLIGQHHGSCSTPSCTEQTRGFFGTFSATYPNIAGLLAGGSDDWMESNDACSSPRTVSAGVYRNLIVKSSDPDWYRLSVPAGKRLRITLQFTHAYGDIDMKLRRTCSGAPVASSTGVGNTEVVSVVSGSSTTTYYLHAYLYSDTRNQYSMSISITNP